MATQAQIQQWLRANPNATRAQMQQAMRQHGVSGQQAAQAMAANYGAAPRWNRRGETEQAVRLAGAAAPSAGAAYEALRRYGILADPSSPRGESRNAALIGRVAGPGVNMGGAQSMMRTIDPFGGLGMRDGQQQAWGVGGKTFGPAGDMAQGMQPGQMRNLSWQEAARLGQWGSRPTYSPYRPWAPGEGVMPDAVGNPYGPGAQHIWGGSMGGPNRSYSGPGAGPGQNPGQGPGPAGAPPSGPGTGGYVPNSQPWQPPQMPPWMGGNPGYAPYTPPPFSYI